MEIQKEEHANSGSYFKIVAILIMLILTAHVANSMWREQLLLNAMQNIKYANILLEKQLEIIREYHAGMENGSHCKGMKFSNISKSGNSVPGNAVIAVYRNSDNDMAINSLFRIIGNIKLANSKFPIILTTNDERNTPNVEGAKYCDINAVDLNWLQTPSILVLQGEGNIFETFSFTGRENAELLELINNIALNITGTLNGNN